MTPPKSYTFQLLGLSAPLLASAAVASSRAASKRVASAMAPRSSVAMAAEAAGARVAPGGAGAALLEVVGQPVELLPNFFPEHRRVVSLTFLRGFLFCFFDLLLEGS